MAPSVYGKREVKKRRKKNTSKKIILINSSCLPMTEMINSIEFTTTVSFVKVLKGGTAYKSLKG